MDTTRDIGAVSTSTPEAVRIGRKVIATIGIDRYQHWRPLANAVGDANGALNLFRRLGFEEAVPPLRDAEATRAALDQLVTEDLTALGSDDSLIIFYAGHGGARDHRRAGRESKTGYLIPIDAEHHKPSTWIDLVGWLRAISLLPPRHILVIVDACYSGIALDPVVKWRDDESVHPAPFETLQARSSRRIITSALDDERALDGGPVSGHSLFTGCLIEGLTCGIPGLNGQTTGADLAVWLRQRVRTYPEAKQTPDFGTFDFHDRGEIVIPLLRDGRETGADEGRPSLPPRVQLEVSTPVPGRVRPARLLTSLRREGEWLAVVGPLLLTAAIGSLARSC